MRRVALAALLVVSCDDTLFLPHGGGGGGGGGTTSTAEGWCAVAGLVANRCLSCHSAAVALGGLDLETDPHGALVDGASASGAPYVVPGDPEGSLFFRKLTGDLAAGEGTPMPPPAGGLDPALLDAVRTWIAEGADAACEEVPTSPTGPARHHPDGWALPSAHGTSTKLGEDDCRSCHGAELDGGEVGIGCDDCHVAEGYPDWAAGPCTFCHGDRGAEQPAPPQDIDDNDDIASISFPAHRAHVEETETHLAYDCGLCHTKPTSALSPGHLFDDATPGVAEVVLTAAPGPEASYDGGSCTVWCHGNGRTSGAIDVRAVNGDGEPLDIGCGYCHGVSSSGAWERMSGNHEKHLDDGRTCNECHPTVSGPPYALVDKERHLDGEVVLALPDGMAIGPDGCTGSCHGEQHNGRDWFDD